MLDQVYLFIFNNGPQTEQQIAKKFYNGRVLPARQTLQWLLWNGFVTPQQGKYVAIVKQ